ncbi:hypothetical protein [Maricaulis sp.]|uniref:hypothetical protein n=1 Tax=Maricaulis sp. TaxID=1486257 RepID=UPI0025BBB69B|nr:hypothetical protein [Maricaulis sp.]
MMAVCLVLLLPPLFFISQILLELIGRPELNAFGEDGRNLFAHTPTASLIAPFVRAPVLIACLVLLHFRSSWIVAAFVVAATVHLVSWLSILTNNYFTLPTGYATLAAEAIGAYLLLRFPELRGQKTLRADR